MNDILDSIQRGMTVFIPGSAAEPTSVLEAMKADPERFAGVHFLTSFIPGINNWSPSAWHESITETAFFMRPSLSESMKAGRAKVIPLSYFGVAQYISAMPTIDITIAQVSPPDANGHCSMGLSPEFTRVACRNSRKVLGLINEKMPALRGSLSIDFDAFAAVHYCDFVPCEYRVGSSDDVSTAIATHLAKLIDNGDTLQLGLGKMPAKVFELLTEHRNLKVHSGMVSDGFALLARYGCLDENYRHTACTALGTKAFYDDKALDYLWLDGVDSTHSPARLAQLERFVAVNSALQVDLWGQANLEVLNGKQVSSAGGALDFTRAARNSISGKSIIALPATADGGNVSRIVGSLAPGSPVSISRHDVEYVVTEYGIADLTGLSDAERAVEIAKVAAPGFRDGLLAQM